jgi:NAD(P)-dependent dehydrogenase (short-subunit alcohol dehydrogenase family)
MATTLVTGTSTGIGHATALHMARKGHRVFATMRKPAASDLAGLAAAEGLSLTVLALDVDDDASVRAAVDQALSLSGRIDVLVNNAGLGFAGPLEEMPLSDIRQVMETNFFGALRCIQAVVPAMRGSGGGHIVNVTSVAGRVASAAQGAYSASKWALEAASESLAQEVAQFGIRVAIVEPGIIQTPIFGKLGAPNPSTRYTHTRRLARLFAKANEHPVSPFVVAEKIETIVSSGSTTLRHPVGPDAEPFLMWRRSMSDEEWVAVGALDDRAWGERVKRDFGLDLGLS